MEDIWTNDAPRGMAESPNSEVCRPNFEQHIKVLTENLACTTQLFEALKSFITERPSYRFNAAPLAALLGHLYVEKSTLATEREAWIKKQEEYEKQQQS